MGENKIINGLWIGSSLSPLELLTLHSFVAHGHEFHLWLYDEIENTLPKGVLIQDANRIIPKSNVFKRRKADPKHGIGKGSFGSPFSDLFRYKLLYEVGGWWVDMDVTCLKRFEFDVPFFFRNHPILPMIGNIIKAPKKSELMRKAYKQTLAECDENTKVWLRPNEILNSHIHSLGLEHYIQYDKGSVDWWEEVEPFLKHDKELPDNWYFIHWMNEEWRNRDLVKNRIACNSSFFHLCVQNNVPLKCAESNTAGWFHRLWSKVGF